MITKIQFFFSGMQLIDLKKKIFFYLKKINNLRSFDEPILYNIQATSALMFDVVRAIQKASKDVCKFKNKGQIIIKIIINESTISGYVLLCYRNINSEWLPITFKITFYNSR